MKSLVYEGNHTLSLKETAAPETGSGEVLIKVAFTGICGTDILIWHDKHIRVKPPVILGHEFSGVIEKVGSPGSAFKPGDRVIVEPLLSCGECPGCRQGDYNLCTSMGLVGIDMDGSMTDYVKVPESKVLRLPDSVSLLDGAFIEPLAVAVHMVRKVAGLEKGDTVLVTGGGPIGLIAGAVARLHGADVYVSEITPFRIDKALELGFKVITGGQESVGDQLRKATEGKGAKVAFEATGVPSGLSDCVDAVGVKGQVVIVGLPKTLPALDTNQVVAKEVSLVGSRVYTAVDFEYALELLESGKIDPQDYISKVIRLDDVIEEGFEAIQRGEPVVKIIVDHRLSEDAGQ